MNDLRETQDNGIVVIPACNVIPNCQLSTDIVLVSSDGHRFGTHTQNLGQFTGGFPHDITPTNGEEVRVPDMDSAALALFLQYVHHHRQPDLMDVRFETLKQLAEAAEKYDVYSAIEICRMHMKYYLSRINSHPGDVFQYAVRHNYPRLMDDAARIAVQDVAMFRNVLRRVNDDAILAALNEYIEYWRRLFDDCRSEPPPVPHRGGKDDWELWKKFSQTVRCQAKFELATFANWKNIIDGARPYLKDCRHCAERADKWASRAAGKISDSAELTPFSSFL